MASDVFGDPVLLGVLAALILFFFFLYLMVRRTILGFREGLEDAER